MFVGFRCFTIYVHDMGMTYYISYTQTFYLNVQEFCFMSYYEGKLDTCKSNFPASVISVVYTTIFKCMDELSKHW